MKKTFIIIFSILLSCLAHAQLPPGREATERERALLERSHDCAKTLSIPLSQRIRKYPFNRTTRIQLVSFKSSRDTLLGGYYRDSLPRQNDTVCFSKLFETYTLSLIQIDRLTDLIYNYGFKFKYMPKGDVYFIATAKQCYNPRNAILFLDKDNKVFEFIEICFECEQTRTSSEKLSLGTDCNQKFLLIKDFFKSTGIQYGVSDRAEDEE
ncbi:MAG: hypothetical protein QM802_21265 [Agriterribacter sp.]